MHQQPEMIPTDGGPLVGRSFQGNPAFERKENENPDRIPIAGPDFFGLTAGTWFHA